MRIILFLVIVVLFLIIFSNRSISKQNKIIFALLLGIVFVVGYFYESHLEKQERNMLSKLEAFKQGKILICRDKIKVDKKHFDYFSSTQTFAAKPNSRYPDMIVSVNACIKAGK